MQSRHVGEAREVIILLVGIFFNLLLYAVIVLAVLTHVTVIQRILFCAKNKLTDSVKDFFFKEFFRHLFRDTCFYDIPF